MREGGAGPLSMIVESAPLVAIDTTRARGISPDVAPACAVPTSASAGPVKRNDEFESDDSTIGRCPCPAASVHVGPVLRGAQQVLDIGAGQLKTCRYWLS